MELGEKYRLLKEACNPGTYEDGMDAFVRELPSGTVVCGRTTTGNTERTVSFTVVKVTSGDVWAVSGSADKWSVFDVVRLLRLAAWWRVLA